MSRAPLDTFESDFENVVGGNFAHRAKPFQRVFADPRCNFAKLDVGQTAICLGKGDQIIAVPDRKGEIRKQVGAAS